MKLTNSSNLSLSVAVWLANDNYDHNFDPNHISATGILKPVRMIILGGRIPPTDIEFDVLDQIPSSMGTSLHEGIEDAWKNDRYKLALHKMGYPDKLINRIFVNPDRVDKSYPDNAIFVYMEQRASKKVGKHTVSGKFDFVGDGTLEDFKSTGTYGYTHASNDEQYALQGSIYKWLNPDIITSDYMLIQYIFTDWSKLKAMIQKDYPQHRLLAKKIMLHSTDYIEKYITDKLAVIDSLITAPDSKLPMCTKEELWQGDSVFKYYKNPESRTRATKNFDAYNLAHERYLNDGGVGIIIEVIGQVKRCLYCNAYDICEQKNAYILNGSLIPKEG